ncbi:MAG: hypothetical protein ABR585_12730 [Gemmatimonadaceae bacterium]
MRAALLKTELLLLAFLGCRTDPISPDFPAPEVPSLESVNFAAIGAGKVAFERIGPTGYNTIYVIDATAMTSPHFFDNQLEFGAAISPDGQRIAYATYDNATLYDAFASNLDGSGLQHVTRFALQEGPPSWSPDGAKIVVSGGNSNSLVYDVYSQTATTNPSDQTQLTHFSATPGVPVSCPVIIDNQSRVAISSQGALTFACLNAEVDVLSSTETLVASYKPARTDRTQWPNLFAAQWAPDGTRIAFIETTSNVDANFLLLSYALKVMNADGTNVTALATIPIPASANVQTGGGWVGMNNYSLCWMPDASRLVFNVPETSTIGHLWVVKSDGTGLTQLTSSPGVYDRSVSCSR